MSRRRHRSSTPFSFGNLGNILNNVDMGTLASVLSQFAPMNASQGGSPLGGLGNLGNLGNIGNIASLISQFTSSQGPLNQNMFSQGQRRNTSRNTNHNTNHNTSPDNRSNNFGDFDIETFSNILSQMGFGNGLNQNNNYGYSSQDSDTSVDEYIDATPREEYEAGEDVIELLRVLKRFLSEDRRKVIDAMITLYEENSK